MEENDKRLVQEMIEEALRNDFMKKIGDTPTDALQLTPKKFVDQIASVVYASIIGLQSSVTTVAASVTGLSDINIFGTGFDGVAIFDGSSSVSGATRSGGTYTLTRDVYYSDVSVLTASVKTASYQMYCMGTTWVSASGKIMNKGFNAGNGGNGGNGTNVAGGAAGSAGEGGSVIAAATLPGAFSGANGGNGGTGGLNTNGGVGEIGPAGQSLAYSIGVHGATGKSNSLAVGGNAGAKTGGSGGAAGGTGTISSALSLPYSFMGAMVHADTSSVYVQHTLCGSSGGTGGGGGGASDNPNQGGGGGGGSGGNGGNGGMIALYSRRVHNNATFGLDVSGGNAGNGGNGGNGFAGAGAVAGGGGGGGGTGGTGGVILIVYESSVQGGSFNTDGGLSGGGGTFGTGSGGGQSGTEGASGNSGASGRVWTYQV